MKYNTQQSRLRIAAYGRNVQHMVEQAIAMPRRADRNAAAHTIIRVMASLRPEEKGQPDYEQKLWDHLAYISDYRLDIDYPVEITRKDEEGSTHPHMDYPMKKIRQRQYGARSEESLHRIAAMPESPLRDKLLGKVANQMKRDLFTWNPGAMSDRKVMADIERMSEDRLHLPDNFRFANPMEKQRQGRNCMFSQMRTNKKKLK